MKTFSFLVAEDSEVCILRTDISSSSCKYSILNSWKSGYQKEVGRLESNVACGYGGVIKYRGTFSRAETVGMGLRPGSAEGWRGEMIERLCFKAQSGPKGL